MAHFIHEDTKQIVRTGFEQEPYFSDPKWICNNNQKQRFDELVAESIVPSLESVKNNKIAQISMNTKNLIYKGFTYDGKHYGATEQDQNNWNSLDNKVQRKLYKGTDINTIFPIENKVKDFDGNYVTIPDFDYFDALLDAGEEHVNTYRRSHTTLVDSVNACTTLSEVADIVDSRT